MRQSLGIAGAVTVSAVVGITADVGLSGAQPTRSSRPRTEPPAVRIISSDTPDGCGEWGAMTVEACREVATCDARKAASSDLDPLSATLERAIASSLGRSCTGLSCGPAETRKDSNNFACRGRTQLCMTRSLEYACKREAATRTPSSAPQTRPPSAAPQTRAPARVATPEPQSSGASRGAPAAAESSAALMEPAGGSGQHGMAKPTAAAATATVTASAAPRRSTAKAGAAYLFPGKADELESGEYWYWKAPDGHGEGTQKYAYDLTSGRFDDDSGKWTECESGRDGKPKCGFCYDAARNEDCLVYNEPLYAMASGVVERCWRNAPENPSPGESHPGRTSIPKRIGGGGNALVVRNDDGTYALYAHMRPGTIPLSICSKTKELMDNADDGNEGEIPEGQRPRVTAGQFIGRVGNTGASSNPHTHVHIQDGPDKSADGVPLNFGGGFIADADSDYEDAWMRLNGSVRPTKTSAIWPSFSAGLPEIAYHGLPAATYQKLFDHAANSGYRLEWIRWLRRQGQDVLQRRLPAEGRHRVGGLAQPHRRRIPGDGRQAEGTGDAALAHRQLPCRVDRVLRHGVREGRKAVGGVPRRDAGGAPEEVRRVDVGAGGGRAACR